MAKAVISSILEAQLGKYVDGLSSDSLQVGLWSGELVLTNLSLKPHALAELELPVTVVRGSIARIHVVVPWNHLGSASVQVSIEGIYALVAPNAALPTRTELAQAKMNRLERHELVRQHNRFAALQQRGSDTNDSNNVDESTFLSRLTERIVDNLHVTLRDIHLRYEDCASNANAPFACGVMIERFAFHTTDAEGRNVFVDRHKVAGTTKRDAFVHKCVALDNIGVYWDRLDARDTTHWVHKSSNMELAMAQLVHAMAAAAKTPSTAQSLHAWLLRPCSLSVQLTKNESLDYSVAAKFTVRANVHDVALALARDQFEDAQFVVAAFQSRQAIEMHFLTARGRPLYSPTTRPLVWWDYATRLVVQGLLHRSRGPATRCTTRMRLRWSTVQRAGADRRRYITAFRAQQRAGGASKATVDAATANALDVFESAFPVDVVLAVRDFADDVEAAAALKRRRAASQAPASRSSSSEPTSSSSGSSWYGYFFGGAAASTHATQASADSLDDDDDEDDNAVLTAEGRADLQQAYDDVATKQQTQTVPRGCNLVSVQLQLKNGSLSLLQAHASASTPPLLTARADGSLAVNVQPSDEWDARFRLERFDILNGCATNTAFATFCSLSSAAKVANPNLPCVSIDAKLRHEDTDAITSNNINNNAALHVRLSAMPIRVLVDPAFVLAVQRFFARRASSEQQHLERVWSFATSSVSDWIFADPQQQSDEHANAATTSTPIALPSSAMRYDVAVDMSAPVFVIPERVDDPHTNIVIVDLGQVAIRSDAAAAQTTSDDDTTLRWRLEVANVQLLLGRLDALNWTDAGEIRNDRFATLVEQLNLAFDVETLAALTTTAPLQQRPAAPRAMTTTPTVSVRATIPHIAVTLAENQLLTLARIHSALLAQVALADNDTPTQATQATRSANNAVDTVATTSTSTKAFAAVDTYYLQVQVVFGDITATLRESLATTTRDALQLRVTHVAFDLAVFASQYVLQARLESLEMDDLLYAPTSRFRQLMSTGTRTAADDQSEDRTHLVAIDVTMYPTASPSAAAVTADWLDDHAVVAREASFLVVDVQFNVLDVQWNPSSMSLLARIATAYVAALQHHSIDTDVFAAAADDSRMEDAGQANDVHTAPKAASPRFVDVSVQSQLSSAALPSSLPSIVARASLVQFSVTFNKDDLNRQLVQLAIKDASLEFTTQDVLAADSTKPQLLAPSFALTGQLGNFIATDLSMAKHAVYTPLVGLDESLAASAAHGDANSNSDRHRPSALLTFSYTLDPRVSDKSVLGLHFEAVRMVYYHQQVLELADYFFEGILGAMVSETLISAATQLLLSEAESSVVLDVTCVQPTVVLPVTLADPSHVALTAASMKLRHAPTSAVHFYGTGSLQKRRKVVAPGEALAASVVRQSDCVSLRLDYKQVTLTGVNVFCVSTPSFTSGAVASTRQSIVATPIDVVVDCEDIVASDIRLDCDTSDDGGASTTTNVQAPAAAASTSSQYLPRFTIKAAMTELELLLERRDYVLLVGLVLDNFGAEQLQVAPSNTATSNNHPPAIDVNAALLPASRLNVSYTYSRTDLDAATIELAFVMTSLRCILFEDDDAGDRTNDDDSRNMVDANAIAHDALRSRTRVGATAATAIVASDVAMALHFVRDADPHIAVRVASFVVRALDQSGVSSTADATSLMANSSGETITSESLGVVLVGTQPTQVLYTWDETNRTCDLELQLSSATGVVVPDVMLGLVAFFAVPPPRSGPPALERTYSDNSGSRSPLVRRLSLSEPSSLSDEPPFAMTIRLHATHLALDVPQAFDQATCPRLSLRADVSATYTWKPALLLSNKNDTSSSAASSGASDFDIQSSVVIDARAIEVVVKNANRQGCRVSYDMGNSSSATDRVDIATMVQLLEPCDLHIEVSDLFPHAGQQQQIVALQFTPIEVFASYDDCCIGVDTMRTMEASWTQYERKQQQQQRQRRHATSAGVRSPKALTRSTSSSSSSNNMIGTEIHRYFTCEVHSVQLTVINDCDGCDMGLVQMHLQRCNVFMNATYGALSTPSQPSTITLSGGGGFVLMLSYYNPDTRTWHEMCRDWSLDISLQGSMLGTNDSVDGNALPTPSMQTTANELHIIVTANQPLELLVTHGLLEVVASAGGAWNRRRANCSSTNTRGSAPASPVASSTSHSKRSTSSSPRARDAMNDKKHAPCVVRNETGLTLRFWLTNGQQTTQPQTLSSSALADLHYIHTVGRGAGVVRKYASLDRDDNMRLCVELVDAAFQPVHGIVFEQLGSRAFPLVDTSTHAATQFTLNCFAKLVDGRILLALSSQIKLVNNLSMPVALLVNDPTWHAPVDIGVLYPSCESAVPVLLSLGTELRVRPIDDAFSWSAPIPIQTRSALEQQVDAAANSSATDVHSAIFCVTLSVEQSLRVVCLSEPIRIVNKLPVELAYRVKSPLLQQRRGSNTTTKTNALGVGANGGIWWTDSTQRPQFQLTVDGCKPSKWLELVHPGTTSGDVVAVGLERLDGRPFRLLIQVVEDAAKSMHVSLYAELWLVNRTGLELVYGNEADAEAYVPPRAARALVGNAQLCAFSSVHESSSGSNASPVVRLRMRSCNWSSRFVADPRRMSWQDECLSLRSSGTGGEHANMLYEFGVSADYATRHFGSITTLVSIIPRYLVLNRSSHTVLLLEDAAPSRGRTTTTTARPQQDGNAAHHILARGDVYALYWVTGARSKLHASVLGDQSDYGWSTTFSIDDVTARDVVIPSIQHHRSGSGDKATNVSANVTLQVAVKRGSISQATFVVVLTDVVAAAAATGTGQSAGAVGVSPSSAASPSGWDTFSVHTQIAGIIVTVADRKLGDDSAVTVTGTRSVEKLKAMQRSAAATFTTDANLNEDVARLTISRIGLETTMSRAGGTAAKLNVMGVQIEDLLLHSKNPVVLRPVFRSGSYDSYRTRSLTNNSSSSGTKYFLEVTYIDRPHPKHAVFVEKLHVELQDVKITTSMRFIDRLNWLLKETIAHFESRSLASSSLAATTLWAARESDANLLAYFVATTDDDDVDNADMDDDGASMASLTGTKIYVESCVIEPVRVVVSFTRDKRDTHSSSLNFRSENFWLANLKVQIDNACVTLDAYRLTHALATQEALLSSLSSFYVTSVKSQALGLIESIQVTSLVTSIVTGGVSTLMSTLLGKTDPRLAAAGPSSAASSSNSSSSLSASTSAPGTTSASRFKYQFQTNAQIVDKHSRLLAQCTSSAAFHECVRHLVFDWDSNHTGLEARGCVALAIQNNSRHALVLTTKLVDGAELRVLPRGRRTLAGVTAAGGSSSTDTDVHFGRTEWRADRAVVVFAYGYTPTLLTSGDVYFTLQSNACNVFVTRKTARLKANVGYTATFTQQETQPWWATHSVIVGDDITAHAAAAASSSTSRHASQHRLSAADASGSTSHATELFGGAAARTHTPPDEYEVVFTTEALGLIAKQSGRNAVLVRELCALPSGAPGPALANGEIAPGDTIVAVAGVRVTTTTQFAQLVSQRPRPLVVRLQRTSEQVSTAYDLFGEAPAAASQNRRTSRESQSSSTSSTSRSRQTSGATEDNDDGADSYDLFGAR